MNAPLQAGTVLSKVFGCRNSGGAWTSPEGAVMASSSLQSPTVRHLQIQKNTAMAVDFKFSGPDLFLGLLPSSAGGSVGGGSVGSQSYEWRWLPICERRCCGPPLEAVVRSSLREEGLLLAGEGDRGSEVMGTALPVPWSVEISWVFRL